MNVNIREHDDIDAWVVEGPNSALTLALYAWGQWMWPGFQKNVEGIKAYDQHFDYLDKHDDGTLILSKDGPDGKLKLERFIDMLREYGIFSTFNGAKKEAAECVPS